MALFGVVGTQIFFDGSKVDKWVPLKSPSQQQCLLLLFHVLTLPIRSSNANDFFNCHFFLTDMIFLFIIFRIKKYVVSLSFLFLNSNLM